MASGGDRRSPLQPQLPERSYLHGAWLWHCATNPRALQQCGNGPVRCLVVHVRSQPKTKKLITILSVSHLVEWLRIIKQFIER